jgi:hypothetical protein
MIVKKYQKRSAHLVTYFTVGCDNSRLPGRQKPEPSGPDTPLQLAGGQLPTSLRPCSTSRPGLEDVARRPQKRAGALEPLTSILVPPNRYRSASALGGCCLGWLTRAHLDETRALMSAIAVSGVAK